MTERYFDSFEQTMTDQEWANQALTMVKNLERALRMMELRGWEAHIPVDGNKPLRPLVISFTRAKD